MRKKSKYKPKRILLNPVGFVMESITPIASHKSLMLNLKIKNHGALEALTKGKATTDELETLVGMANMCEAFTRLKFGVDYSNVVKTGLEALYSVGKRGENSNSFILRATEMNALNDMIDLHDAQLELVSLRDVEMALAIVNEEHRLRKTVAIKGKSND